jgi:hypothetical protein
LQLQSWLCVVNFNTKKNKTLQMYGVRVTVFFGEGCLHLAVGLEAG